MALAAAVLLAAGGPAAADQRGDASWYGDRHHGRLQANGKPFDMNGWTVAHRTLPLGTQVRVRSLRTKRSVRAEVTDRGPYVGKRIVDLSRGVARRLGIEKYGVSPVAISVVRRPGRR